MSGPAWGTPPWRIDLRLERTEIPARSRVAVVGGGFTGLASAFQLARRGVEVDLFEAGRIGRGASGRTGVIVLEETAAGPLAEVESCF